MSNLLAGHMRAAADEDQLLDQLAFNEKMAELGKMAAGLVHELNTPLSVIASAAQMIMREEELSDPVKELVERIGEEARRLSQLAKGLLSFSREDDRLVGETDVNDLLIEVLALLTYEAQKHSITVREEFDYELLPVAANANRLKQIFINLVMNAIQAMGESGGTLLVRTLRPASSLVRVEVGDTGGGIPRELLERVFEPFYTTKNVGEGTGLGLYITKGIVESLGGTVTVTSEVGRGTLFSITLPVAAL